MLKDGATGEPAVALDDCSGCGGQIQDRYYLSALDRLWHDNCLRCSECQTPLDLSCYARDGNIFCKEDYLRLFCLKNCARCGIGIPANELIMKAKELVFHMGCFICVACGTLLSKGDIYGLRDGMLFCRIHYENACLDDVCDDDINHVYRCQSQEQLSENESSHYYPPGSSTKGRQRKRRNQQGSPDDFQAMRIASNTLDMLHRDLSSSMESLNFDSSVTSPSSVTSHSQQRNKRMRTSFKHHQLRTMKSYFAINQNPDAKDLKQLAQKTGLSKRVLQVWFQNARAKWRRNIMRQESGQHGQLTPNGSASGGLGVCSGPGLGPGLLMSQSPQQTDGIRIHTPLQHAMAYNDMY